MFALFAGIALSALGEKGAALVRGAEALSEMMLQITHYVMRYAPVAVFGALAAVVSKSGLTILLTYLELVGEFYLSLALLWTILLSIGAIFLGRRIWTLIRYIREPMLIAFTTASSEAAYPKLMDRLDHFGVDEVPGLVVEEAFAGQGKDAGPHGLGELDGALVARVDAGLAEELGPHPALMQRKIAFGTRSARVASAMSVDQAHAAIRAGMAERVLLVGAEVHSAALDLTTRGRTVAALFGDGAGAAVIGSSDQPAVGLIGTKLGAYGDCVDLLCIPGGGSNAPATTTSLAGRDHFIKMKGKEVFKYAVRGMEEAARDILEQHSIPANQIALVIPHQANLRIIEAIAQYLELPLERFFVNLDRYGNTSAASIPIALDEARRSGRIKPGDLTLLVAFGAGLTYGSALLRW